MVKIVREGLVAGAAGGLVTSVYLMLVVEPILADALALEERGRASSRNSSRGVQQAGA